MGESKYDEMVLDLFKKEVAQLHELLSLADLVTEVVTLGECTADRCVINVKYSGNDLGFMIGSNGNHLRSLQWILALVVKRELDKQFGDELKDRRITVIVDAGGYLTEQKERVERLALNKADDARITGETVELMPMNAYERRAVHMILSKFSDIESVSVGEGGERRITIVPKSTKELGIERDASEEEAESEE